VRVAAYKAGTHKRWFMNLKHTTGSVWTGQHLIPRWSGVVDGTFGTT
jgi:hypothetical protein